MSNKLKHLVPVLAMLFASFGCEKALDVVPKDELAPGNVLTSAPELKPCCFLRTRTFKTNLTTTILSILVSCVLK